MVSAMLTPETLDALKQALSAVIDQAGDDPKYSGLVDALTQAQRALPHEGGHDAEEEPDDSFEHAKERMIAARKAGAAE